MLAVRAVFVECLGIHEMKFIKVIFDIGIDFFDDFSSHISQLDHPFGTRDLEFITIRDDGLAKTHRISPFVDIFGVVVPGTIMEI